MASSSRKTLISTLIGGSCAVALGLGLLSFGVFNSAKAADHGDAPLVSNDQGADIADVYTFLDPNDNDFVVFIITARGFITPGESENLGFFQSNLNWRFAIENSGDANPDMNIEVTFADRTDFLDSQTSFIKIRVGSTPTASFTAPTTVSNARTATANPFIVTTDPATNISFFAGMTDDPFFFDVSAELLFRESLIQNPGTGNASVFSRGRDTFAGYNVMTVALRVPRTMVEGSAGNLLGFSGYTELAQRTKRSRSLGIRDKGRFINVDRMGIPAINTVFIPYPRKDEYNRGSTSQDAAGVYQSDIVASLTALGTSTPNIGILAGLAVTNGDILRLDMNVANTGNGGGSNAAAAFPNGRRVGDDVIDTIVNIIANQQFGNPAPTGPVDNVDSNDVPFTNTFPFVALPNQPRANGVTDDGTRN